MKKLLVIGAAALLMMGVAGQAMASFSSLDLIRVVYQTGSPNTEVATDLGAISTGGSPASLSLPADAVYGTGANAFSTAQFGGAAFNTLNVAYFAIDDADSHMWISASSTPSLGKNKGPGVSSGMDAVLGDYQSLTGTTVTTTKGDGLSFQVKLGTGGTFGGLITSAVGYSNLAALASGGSVTQNLYYIDSPQQSVLGVQGLDVATIKTLADGTTEIINPNATAAPIPPSVLLMGSGLLGLVGIRRRFVA